MALKRKTLGLLICIVVYVIMVLVYGAAFTAGIMLFHIAVVPLIFKYSKSFRRTLIFANFIKWPLNTNFEEPSSCGIQGARNVNIEYQSKVDNCSIRIGIWHILPKTVYERLKERFEGDSDKEELSKVMDEELASSKTPIIMYCHGNANSRAAAHRLLLYKFFQELDYHTIAFDYRGYGDSTKVPPSEDGVVEDALVVYDWLNSAIEKSTTKPPVFVWGHSLGTGVSSHLLGNLEELSRHTLEREQILPPPKGLILEAPFNNLADEVSHHILSTLVKWLPYYESSFVAPFRGTISHEPAFRSDEHLAKVRQLPLLILHAEDDIIVPFVVGLKLYRAVSESRTEGGAVVTLHAFDKKAKLGHKYICNSAELPQVVKEFISANQ